MFMSTKEKILEKASELFAQYGYQETSIRKIAKEAKANSAMISYYFGSKKALYESVLSTNMDEFLESVSRIKAKDEKEFLKKFIKIHIGVLKKRGKYISYLMLKESATNFEQVKSLKDKYFDPLANIITRVFKTGIEKKIFKPYNEQIMLQLLIGINVMLALKNPQNSIEELSNIAYDVFMRGICA
ncbi:MAG: hypothetical protein C0173_06355 [Desulfurella sp.]|nr:MAG: hypothetical protein C0173_06355 [Desulfurella sp.]HEX13164.1 TetR/AcrR family transcriptional regulator [Desulfurella acetivorans]